MTNITWDEYLADLETLRDRVRGSCVVSGVGGLWVDGVMPAVYLAAQLGVDYLSGPHLAAARAAGKPVLGVLGYVPDGDPEGKLWGFSREDPRNKTAVLYAGMRLPHEPDLIVRRVDGMVSFPYERPR